jgi:predicted permease
MDLWLPYPEDAAAARRIGAFHEELLRRLRAMPGVDEAGGVNAFPLSGSGANGMFLVLESADEVGDPLAPGPEVFERLEALAQNPERTGYAEFRIASEGYFRAMGIPLIEGRLFDERDAPDAPHVAVISRSLAEERWPREDPLGKVIEFGNMDGDLRPFTIVGVVGDVRERSLDAPPAPTLYAYSRQRPRTAFNFHVLVRGSVDAAALAAAAREIVGELNPDAAVEFRTLEQVFSSALAERQFTLVLMAVFGAIALLLAALGIYGVVSYLVSQRLREIGVRMALGASADQVLRLFVRQGLVLAFAGVACGVLAAVGLTRFLAGLLYEVSAVDAATFAAVALLLTGVALAACYVPARRASRVDPMVTLRRE